MRQIFWHDLRMPSPVFSPIMLVNHWIMNELENLHKLQHTFLFIEPVNFEKRQAVPNFFVNFKPCFCP